MKSNLLSLFIFLISIIIIFAQGDGSNIQLPSTFNVIGPFEMGEREMGLDTLEAYGGIFNLPIGDNSTYPSELGTGGRVGWSVVQSATPGTFSVDFDEQMNWSFYQQVWGWTIWLWYGYAIGEFTVSVPDSYIIDCTGIKKYYLKNSALNENEYFYELLGDFYSYGTGQQLVNLVPGDYQLYFRIESSVRLNQSPVSSFTCTIQSVSSLNQLMVIPSESIMSDIVGGLLASPYASITVINTNDYNLPDITVELSDSSIFTQKPFQRNLDGVVNQPVTILPGHKLSIPIYIELNDNVSYQCPIPIPVNILSQGKTLGSGNLTLNCTDWGNPYLFTFLDFDQTVQYAMATPPAEECPSQTLCSVVLALHGAGVEASYMGWVNAVPKQNTLWTVFPTGRRSWGYDWNGASRRNAFYALEYLASAQPGVPSNLKPSLEMDPTKILVLGHSMGGFGCHLFSNHFTDLVLGSACAAGFVKLQQYVVYHTRPGFAFIDPVLQGLLMASIAENDNDLYATNMVGIPLLVRYGQNDSNVNPWHSRRLARMISELSRNSSAVIENEVPNEGHWFNGMLNDEFMQNYYNSIESATIQYHPPVPDTIIITTNNPGTSGSRANILILQTEIPGRVARIRLTKSPGNSLWTLQTQNVARFGILKEPIREDGFPDEIMVDGQSFTMEFLPEIHFYRQDKYAVNSWNQTDDQTWSSYQRSAMTYGPIRQIFEKPFIIVYGTNTTDSVINTFQWAATYIANFYNTNGRGSVLIIPDIEFIPPQNCSYSSNYILLGNSYENLVTSKYSTQLPITFNPDGSFYVGPAYYSQPDIGTSFIAPNECGEGLLLVVAGTDNNGLINALHTLPQISAIPLPDFIVVGNEYGWKGAGGILSTGFFDNNWIVQPQCTYFSLQPTDSSF